MKQKISFFLMVTVLICSISYAKKKEVSNFIDENLPCIPEADFEKYKPITSAYHQVVIRSKRGFEVFGDRISPNGEILKIPTLISPLNGFNYAGIPQMVGLASSAAHQPNDAQGILLTDKGLYVWGNPTGIIDREKKGFSELQLPDGVNASDVEDLQATIGGLMILTSSGDIYVRGSEPFLYGDNVYDSDDNWHKPNVQNVSKISINADNAFVYTKSREYYTWGFSAYLGDGSPFKTMKIPEKMKGPSITGNVPRMIKSTTNLSSLIPNEKRSSSYLVLEDVEPQRIHVLGNNVTGQLGMGDTNDRLSWTVIPNLTRVRRIDASAASTNFSGISAITEDFKPYLWGQNDDCMLSDAAAPGGQCDHRFNAIQTSPIIPSGVVGDDGEPYRITYSVNGGHLTALINMTKYKFGYVGHKVFGSMGTGAKDPDNDDNVGQGNPGSLVRQFDFENTPDIPLCNEGITCIKVNPMVITDHFLVDKDNPIKK